MSHHLDLAYRLINKSIKAEQPSGDKRREVYARKEKKPDHDTTEISEIGSCSIMKPTAISFYRDQGISLSQAINASPVMKRNHLLTHYMLSASEIYKEQDYDNPFWREHYDPNIRIDFDGHVSRGFKRFWDPRTLAMFQNPKLRMLVTEVCISEMASSNTCSVVMTIKYSGVPDELTRGAVLSCVWRRRDRVWICLELYHARGLDGEASGL